MPKYIIFTRLSAQGRKVIKGNPDALPDLTREASGVDARIVHQFALLGGYDFLTVVDVPVPEDAFRLSVANRGAEGVVRTVIPAIDQTLFTRLLMQTTETTGPHKWQASPVLRLVRPAARWYAFGRPVHQFMKPFTVEGRDNVADLSGPAIFIGNHTSHLDSSALLYSLPRRYRDRVFFGAAADRWFIKGRDGVQNQGWYRSLVWSSFPVHRSGGSKALDYPKWLIDKGNSIAIFPEGTRSGSGKLGKFRHGPALLAMAKDVPVVPVYMEGLAAIRPKGSREMKPGPVVARVGPPVRFPAGIALPDATHQLREAVKALMR